MMENQFLLSLAEEYWKLEYLDRALETLAEITETDKETSESARLMELNILLAKRDFFKVISLGEAMGGAENLPSEPALNLALAYWHVGAKDLAFQALMTGFKYVPTVPEVQDFLKAIPPHQLQPKTPDVETLLETAAQSLMGYLFALDNLAPLIWEARSLTCCFHEQVPLLYISGKNPDEAKVIFLEFAKILYSEFSIFTAFVPIFTPASIHNPGTIFTKIYLFKEEDFYHRLQELQSLYREEATTFSSPRWRFYMEREAALLGYPECCSQWGSSTVSEVKALTTLVREELRSRFWPDLTPPHYAYFTLEFFPCSPRCPASEATGQRIADCYKETSPILHQLYEDLVIPLNKSRIARYHLHYGHFLRGFDEMVEHYMGESGRSLAQHRESVWEQISGEKEKLH